MAGQFSLLFPTTIMKCQLPGMDAHNRQLVAMVHDMETGGPNNDFGTSTKGGFQTREDLLSPGHPQAGNPALVALKAHISASIREYAAVLIHQECARPPQRTEFVMWGWAVTLRAGNWQAQHVHPGANISGVYYLSVPAIAADANVEEGRISFHDPRIRAHMAQLVTQKTRHTEAPRTGDMLIFPSWLEHSVTAFQGAGERICIAFNARLEMA